MIAAHGRGGIVLFGGTRAAVFDDASLAGEDVFRRTVDVAVTARLQTNVRLARLGDGYVAAWVEDHRIFLSTGAGTTPVAVVGSGSTLIDVLVDRSNIVWVVWAKGWKTVAVSRFWGNLEAIDPGPIAIETPGGLYSTAAAAGDGVIALAYDVSGADDPNARDLAALLLWETGTGIARKDVLLTAQAFPDYNPTVAFDGSAFVYGWLHATGDFPPDAYEPLPNPVVELVAARVTPGGELLDATPVQIAASVDVMTQPESAAGAQGVAFGWQEENHTRVALFHGATIDIAGADMSLGELAPHNGGFLLVRGISRKTPALTQVEYLVLGADLAINATGTLPPYEADSFWKELDIDVIGGTEPVFAYVKSANSVYGNVPRVFVRETGPTPPRRRAVGR